MSRQKFNFCFGLVGQRVDAARLSGTTRGHRRGHQPGYQPEPAGTPAGASRDTNSRDMSVCSYTIEVVIVAVLVLCFDIPLRVAMRVVRQHPAAKPEDFDPRTPGDYMCMYLNIDV